MSEDRFESALRRGLDRSLSSIEAPAGEPAAARYRHPLLRPAVKTPAFTSRLGWAAAGALAALIGSGVFTTHSANPVIWVQGVATSVQRFVQPTPDAGSVAQAPPAATPASTSVPPRPDTSSTPTPAPTPAPTPVSRPVATVAVAPTPLPVVYQASPPPSTPTPVPAPSSEPSPAPTPTPTPAQGAPPPPTLAPSPPPSSPPPSPQPHLR